jgi:carboxymethylenebutenolidase
MRRLGREFFAVSVTVFCALLFLGVASCTNVSDVADELAANGYVVVAPDLLSGHGPDGGGSDSFASNVAHRVGTPLRFDEADDIRRAMGKLEPDEITRRLAAAIRYVRGLASTTSTVSVVGFCWGGTQAWRFATNERFLAATFVFYGSSAQADENLSNISAPVHGFYGENDFRINATLERTETGMAAAEKIFEPVIYEGVGHGFAQAGMGDRRILDADGARLAALRSEQAWKRLLELLGDRAVD